MTNKTNSIIYLVMLELLLLMLCTSTMGKTIFVDDDAAGANDGSERDKRKSVHELELQFGVLRGII